MVTIKVLCDELATALSMSPRSVTNVAENLFGADMISQLDEQATIEDTIMLLIGVTADFEFGEPWSVVQTFFDLPLISIEIPTEAPNAVIWNINLADEPEAAKYREFYGDSLGVVLANLLGDEIWLNASKSGIGGIWFERSVGHTGASIRHDLAERSIYLLFDRPIDDADEPEPHGLPPAYPLRTVENLSSILGILSNALDGASHPWVDAWAAEKYHLAAEPDHKIWRN